MLRRDARALRHDVRVLTTRPTAARFAASPGCEQEDYTDWDYADVTKQTGFIDIEPASPIICALATRNGTLLWTGKKAYVSHYLGLPYVYNYIELADACTPWSPQSTVATSALAVWMGEQGPFSYDGTSILPIACKIRPWVDDDIDLLQVRERACLVHVSDFNEGVVVLSTEWPNQEHAGWNLQL